MLLHWGWGEAMIMSKVKSLWILSILFLHISISEKVPGTYDPLRVFTPDKNWFKRPIYISWNCWNCFIVCQGSLVLMVDSKLHFYAFIGGNCGTIICLECPLYSFSTYNNSFNWQINWRMVLVVDGRSLQCIYQSGN